jgi:HEAT repeat protein
VKAASWLACAALQLLAPTTAAQIWPSSIARVSSALASPDVEVRRNAAQELAALPPSAVRQLLPVALEDLDAEVRVAAGRAAIRVAFDAGARAEAWLADPDPGVRQIAARILGTLGVGTGSVTALARTLSDPVASVRLEAAKAFSNAPAEEGARVLLNHLDDAQEPFVLAVVESLGILGSPSAVLPLVAKVQDPRVAVRRAVVRVLGEVGEPARVTMPLILALADSDPEVRRLAVESTVSARATDAIPALEERLRRDRDIDVQVATVTALMSLLASAADESMRARVTTELVRALAHERQELRSEALASLSRFASSAQQELRECLNYGAGETAGPCALALAHHPSAENVAALVAAWRQSRLDPHDLLTAMSVVGGDQALLVVMELLQTQLRPLREQAIAVAGELLDAKGGDGRAVEPIVEVLRQANGVEEAEKVIELLGRTASSRALSTLLPYLKPATPSALRVAAIRALGRIESAAVPARAIGELLTDDDTAVRAATVLAIRDGRWPTAIEPLLVLLSNAQFDEEESLAVALWGPSEHIRQARHVRALGALIGRGNERVRAPLIEALARVPWKWASGLWERELRRPSCVHRAKVAEVLGYHPEARDALLELSRGACEAAAVNAVWALGYFEEAGVVPTLRQLAKDEDRATAANAVGSLARVATVDPEALGPFFCSQLQGSAVDGNPERAANALAGLRAIERRCDDGQLERAVLRSSPSPQLRLQAARLIAAVPSGQPDADAAALKHCARHDVDGNVGAACAPATAVASPSPPRATSPAPLEPTTVMVIPTGKTSPVAGAPFALENEAGVYRFGWTDARGGVWLQTHDRGALRLEQPLGTW